MLAKNCAVKALFQCDYGYNISIGSVEGGRSSKPSLGDTDERLGDTENDTQSLIPERLHSDPSIKGDSQHAEDFRRVNGVVRSEPQFFRKALVHYPMRNIVMDSNSSDSVIAPSISSRSSDPLVDVPKRKILDEPILPPADQQDTGNKFAAAAAEDAASQVTSSSQSSTPTAQESVIEWGLRDNDISDSRQGKFRNATLGKMEKEISTIAERAVTTNRVGELRKRNPAEQICKRCPSQGRKDGLDKPKHRSKNSHSLPRQLVGATSGSSSLDKTPRKSAEATKDLGQNSHHRPLDSEKVDGTSLAPVLKRSALTKALVLQTLVHESTEDECTEAGEFHDFYLALPSLQSSRKYGSP